MFFPNLFALTQDFFLRTSNIKRGCQNPECLFTFMKVPTPVVDAIQDLRCNNDVFILN